MIAKTLTVKARFDGQVFIPAEPVNLPPGCELEILIVAQSSEGNGSETLAGLFEIAVEFPENPDLPSDLAAQHDHYLYGVPKQS